MFNPAEALRDNPSLFACYILFVYFRGRNAVRIEREMRALGHSTFHRRNLYPRGRQPGWILRHGWQHLSVPPAVAGGEIPPRSSFKQDAQDQQDADTFRSIPSHPVHPLHPVSIPSDDFSSWLKRVSPNMTWDWRHQQVIIEQLKKVTSGDCKRLMIFLPPRHGKSELVSVRYTAWRMQQDPSMNVILGSYNQRLADKMSRKIRTVICDAESMDSGQRTMENAGRPSGKVDQNLHNASGSETFRSPLSTAHSPETVHSQLSTVNSSPFPFSRPRPKNAVSEWETAAGGSFRAVGSGSGVTGFGANLIVIDDPVMNRAQAESETFRNRVWDWYKDDLYTRLEPDGSIILIQTRWHEDDLAGRLLRDDHDKWTIINLPALSEPEALAAGQFADTESPSVPPAVAGGEVPPHMSFKQDAQDIQDPTPEIGNEHPLHPVHPVRNSPFDWREAPNLALCPERFPVEALDKLKTQLGTYSFSALYQQRPTPAGGQIFKREWFKNIIDFAPPGLRWTRGYDLAVSTRTESDYTASFRVAFDDKSGNMYISGGFRRRIEFPEQRRYIIDRMLNERDTQHGVELALHGQALIQDLRRDPALRGKILRGVKVSTDKITRALTWSPIAEDGKVILVRTSIDSGQRTVDNTISSGGNAAVNEPRRRPLNRNSPPYEGGVAEGRGGSLDSRPLDLDSLETRDTEISPRFERSAQPRIETPHHSGSEIVHSPLSTVHSRKTAHSPLSIVSWIDDLLDELAAFPNGTHDDQIDAISIAVQMHSIKPNRAVGMLIT